MELPNRSSFRASYAGYMITKNTIERSIADVFGSSTSERTKIIDEMFEEQPSLILIFQGSDKAATEYEGEVLIQLGCVVWRTFKNESISHRKITKKMLKKHATNNIWMKRLVHGQDDSDSIMEKAFKGYNEIELLKFIHYSLSKQWKEYIRSESSARGMFYSLKTMVDCLVECKK